MRDLFGVETPDAPPARGTARRAPAVFTIPAGTRPQPCRGAGCRAAVYWVTHPRTGRPHPVSVAHPDAAAPTRAKPGTGISHFQDCVAADDFRGGAHA